VLREHDERQFHRGTSPRKPSVVSEHHVSAGNAPTHELRRQRARQRNRPGSLNRQHQHLGRRGIAETTVIGRQSATTRSCLATLCNAQNGGIVASTTGTGTDTVRLTARIRQRHGNELVNASPAGTVTAQRERNNGHWRSGSWDGSVLSIWATVPHPMCITVNASSTGANNLGIYGATKWQRHGDDQHRRQQQDRCFRRPQRRDQSFHTGGGTGVGAPCRLPHCGQRHHGHANPVLPWKSGSIPARLRIYAGNAANGITINSASTSP